ncbi:hypothetical protein [Methanobrevibacter sp.]|uniref:hypothetical protein n=1 Tax=Methanobrevibacter sp. TaxID=66852 RepID=UPI0038687161
MKIKKSFLICIFLLGVLSLGFVCAEDNSSLENMQDDALGEIAFEDSQSDVNILSASPQDSDSTQSNESDSGNKEDFNIFISTLNPIYPWTWSNPYDDDFFKDHGVEIWFWGNENETTGNTTIYLDDEVVYMCQGEFSDYVIEEFTLWQHYNGNGKHTVKVVYSGDENYNPVTETLDFDLKAYDCYIKNCHVVFELPSYVSGILTVKANGRTILTKDIEATYHRYIGYSSETYRFLMEGLDYGVNHIVVSFTGNKYSFDEPFEYFYNWTSKDIVPNHDNAAGNSSQFHREVRAGNDSKVSVGSVVAGNPLLVLALALSSAVLLPRRK